MNGRKQNEISYHYLAGSDLAEREEDIVREIASKTGFTPIQLLGRSSWWTSPEIGAFHFRGKYKNKDAVLKVQGVKPSMSEIDIITSFAEANRSSIVRPPHIYDALPWDDEKKYEALIMESIDGPRIVQSIDEQQVNRFFEIYQEYRANCLQSPWIDKPSIPLAAQVRANFDKWRKASYKLYPNHPYRRDKDFELVESAVLLLHDEYQDVEPEFQHGHFSTRDLYQVGDQVVVLSNLYWSWRLPFYDATFAQHWGLYDLNDLEGTTPQVVDAQRKLWLEHLEQLPQTQGRNYKFLQLALLERAAAGLNLDALSIDPKSPTAEYIVQTTRNELKKLLSTLS